MSNIYTRAMPLDTSTTVRIKRSVSKQFALVLLFLVLAAIGVWLIRGGAIDGRYGGFSVVFGWAGTPMFVLMTILLATRLVFGKNEPITISPDGLLDTRISSLEIPWSTLSRVSHWKQKGTSMVRLEISTDGLAAMQLIPSARVVFWLNRLFGSNGIYVQSNDLEISFHELWYFVSEYAKVHNPNTQIG